MGMFTVCGVNLEDFSFGLRPLFLGQEGHCTFVLRLGRLLRMTFGVESITTTHKLKAVDPESGHASGTVGKHATRGTR